jgi:hypothetical protein
MSDNTFVDNMGQEFTYSQIKAAVGKESFTMALTSDDKEIVTQTVNQGIDAHLEACFIPDRGDSYEESMDRFGFVKLHCRISAESMPVLLRRLSEQDSEAAEELVSAILDYLDLGYE